MAIQFIVSPVNLSFPPRNEKIIGVFAFLVPGRYLNRTSSLPPYGVASQKFVKAISNLALKNKTIKNVKSSHRVYHAQQVPAQAKIL
ncbi:hypothetical protein R605_004528 [Salmonella enterica subsp. enterica]|nr:hypothetical protein SEEP1673_025310 [Salmonella enterica subsp. enterica serovar Poona str. ATCC BAA-1673]EAA8989937.1 hypothetical protein [Salmonella enterica subsp. enterica serovar Pomona]EAM7163942.1 hypothetical protein [Salmonella enterica]EAN3269931.1 hypothetical protein [Salmonella enterica subsp. enterica serovar Oranienburg]EBS5591139.1 hypothetical protein [Salmonella enterica subsp. enterica serovar Newport]ECC9579858.1 hypothetical protein [Salmonella enterica subsp. houtena